MAKKGGFNLTALLNNASMQDSNIENIESFEIKEIDITKIRESKENFYNINDIHRIKQSIELLGIEQNLVVENKGDYYKLIAGHRRLFACKILVSEGKEKFKKVPCRVKNIQEGILNKLTMIMTNSTARELSDWEKMIQALEVEEVVSELKKENKLPGRTRDILAELINVSSSQIARFKAIKNNLTEDLMAEFKNNNISLSVAYKASSMKSDIQNLIFTFLENEGMLQLSDIDDINQKFQERRVLPGQTSIYDKGIIENNQIIDDSNSIVIQEGSKIEDSNNFENHNEVEEFNKSQKEELDSTALKAENIVNKNECNLCGCVECLKTNELGIVFKLDHKKSVLEIINVDTGEVQHLKILYCPICGKKI